MQVVVVVAHLTEELLVVAVQVAVELLALLEAQMLVKQEL